MQHRVSAKEVATLAGVSRAAVSRTFGNGQVSTAIREKVIAAANQLGYRPNAIARSLIGGKTDLIALITIENDSIHNALLVSKLISEVTLLGKRALVIPATADNETDQPTLDAFDYQVDAIVVVGGTVSPRIVDRLSGVGVPLFLYERQLDGTGAECVTCDNAHGARIATRHLIRCGCKRIAYVTKHRQTHSNVQRHQGLMSELNNAGLPLHGEAHGEQSFHGGYRAAIELMSADLPPDALFCFNDEMAIGALEAARAMKLEIPKDIAVIGFDDIPMSSWPVFDLTTITNPIESPVELLIQRISARLEGATASAEAHTIRPSLVVRSTTP